MKLITFTTDMLPNCFIKKDIILAQNKWDLDRELTALICEVFLGNDFSILYKR